MEVTLVDQKTGKAVIVNSSDIKPALKNIKNILHLIREQLLETSKYYLDFVTFSVAYSNGQFVPTEDGPIKLKFRRKGAR